MNYKVIIPTAGVGSRVEKYCKNLNKSFITINNKPVISHIIEKFKSSITFVIALGYKGDLVKQYLEVTYPEINFEFVKIKNYEGKNSGLGYTLNQCKKYLQQPFIFISNDTLFKEQLYIDDIEYNWLGYSKVKSGNKYRSIELDNDKNILKLNDKNKSKFEYSYIGICAIKDYKLF